MQIIRQYAAVPAPLQGGVFALGNFDGVHLGHQRVIGEAARVARELGVPLGVLVFEPHPKQFFFPNEPFFRLTPFRAKARLLESLGVDVLAALPFDADMSKKLAPEFVMDVLVNGLRTAHVVAGYDFRFGKARAGDASVLSYMGEMEGFGVSIVPEATLDGETISSTRIRDLLGKGDPKGAARLLGHWWTIETHVRSGDQRGRTIGFPTANLALEDYVQPAFGVYAVRIEFEDGPHKGVYDGVANLGRRPTFDKEDVLLEVHIFDFAGDIYGNHAAVSFIGFLRPEQKFSGLDALKEQIAKDSARAREILATTPA
ncbi:bifunctional riboflavin kinase/FAD synthetase [Parvibaculum sedimenti]|uniref:Riboflavin biosynthesis protein n=1 Tax=Parvibaculum sedimenti TaxID=2608632 RepID=A0A6N6VIE0_9HYPH|nr:bifunctional riboflavin kinase/FAD synthetase [Parvibaculum sedimenti]KAB7739842.1 bifunctional riboflavin kinase/FAD synthetase [Parvibaculum sedimenti]